MGANTQPIFSKIGDVSSNGTTGMAPTITTATGDYTGVSANHKLVFTADATNGGFIQRLRFKCLGSATQSVARIYINNGTDNTTATNNSWYGEISLPAVSAINTTSIIDLDYPMNIAIPAGFKIFVGLGTTVTLGWVVIPIAGKY